MTGFPWDLAAAAGLLLLNRVTPRALLTRLPVYLGLQLVDLAGLGWFLFVGVHGLEHFPAASWAIAALFAMHLVVNASQRSRARDEADRGQPRR